jgi:hypothetical protein
VSPNDQTTCQAAVSYTWNVNPNHLNSEGEHPCSDPRANPYEELVRSGSDAGASVDIARLFTVAESSRCPIFAYKYDTRSNFAIVASPTPATGTDVRTAYLSPDDAA